MGVSTDGLHRGNDTSERERVRAHGSEGLAVNVPQRATWGSLGTEGRRWPRFSAPWGGCGAQTPETLAAASRPIASHLYIGTPANKGSNDARFINDQVDHGQTMSGMSLLRSLPSATW